jgi:hypothetical protein
MSLEPIPFAGMVETDPEIAYLDAIVAEMYGKNPENMPKYIVLGDGSLYIFHKEEDRYALREQTTPIQEGIPTAEGAGGTTSSQCSGKSTLCDGQEGHRQSREGY